MKIKGTFEQETLGNKVIWVPMNNTIINGFLRANESASLIMKCINNGLNFDEIIHYMLSVYDVSEEIAKENVTKILNILECNNLLER